MGGAHHAADDVAGGAAGIGDIIGGIKGGALSLVNLVTYYKMKDRAGVVGRTGLSAAIRAVRERAPDVRLHLIGHSFGGRVVTSAIAGATEADRSTVDSLSLLQAAFSHHAFSGRYGDGKQGFFRRVVSDTCVRGPTIVTHTRNDRAVGLAYALASRMAGQDASAIGDRDDPYGGLGSNGARDTTEAVDGPALAAGGTEYSPAIGSCRIHNLLADRFVSGHSDIANDAVAYAILNAVAAT
jgi:esterase/lipase superfamily enzyme